MHITEQLYEFQRLLEQINPEFEVKEKLDTDTMLMVLNIAQLRFINQQYLNKGSIEENIEFLQKRATDLRNIIKRTTLTATAISAGSYSGIGYTVNLAAPGDFLYYIRSDSNLNRTAIQPTGSGQYAWTNNYVAKSYDEVEKVLTTPFNKPIIREPLAVFEASNVMILIVDGYTTINTASNAGVALTYLAQPKYLGLADTSTTTTTCELAWQTHEEIVKLAVEIYTREYKYLLGNLKQPKE